MDNILVESFRNSAELSFGSGGGDIIDMSAEIINGNNPVLARSFEETVRETMIMGGGMNGATLDISNSNMTML